MFGENDLERQLAEARASLSEVAESQAAHQIEPTVAEAAEGAIKVLVGTNGRVESITCDPRVLREGSEYLAAELKTAVNDALDKRAEALQGTEEMPDMAAINDTVTRIQDQGLRQMREMTAGIGDVMKKLQGRS